MPQKCGFSGKAQKSKKNDLLLTEEWDFSRIDERHLHACVEWEYCREIPEYCDAVARYRVARAEFYRDGNGFTFPSDTVGLQREPPHYYYPEWPIEPFNTLTNDVRDAFALRVISDTSARLSLGDTRFDESLSIAKRIIDSYAHGGKPISVSAYDDNGYPVTDGTKVWTLFRIRWWLSTDRIVEQFEQWLTNRSQGIEITEDRGAGGQKRHLQQQLKNLGAYRLLKNMTWREAYSYTAAKVGNHQDAPSVRSGLYSNFPRPWRNAAAKAEHQIAAMRAERLLS